MAFACITRQWQYNIIIHMCFGFFSISCFSLSCLVIIQCSPSFIPVPRSPHPSPLLSVNVPAVLWIPPLALYARFLCAYVLFLLLLLLSNQTYILYSNNTAPKMRAPKTLDAVGRAPNLTVVPVEIKTGELTRQTFTG